MNWPHDLLREMYSDPAVPKSYKRRIRMQIPPVEVEYRGCKMLVHPTDNNTEFQIWRMGRTHEERALRKILARLGDQPFTALDVGANAGSFTVRLAAIAAKGSVIHSFEPNPTMRKRLLANLKLNNFKNVNVHDCAISDEKGKLDLHLPNIANLGQARLYEPFEGGTKVSVDISVITDFLPKDPDTPIDFLKVDIEGYEDRAIMPLLAEEHKKQRPRIIFFEHKHKVLWKDDVLESLLENGYKLLGEFGRNALFKYNE